jgi:hypothetical protein
MNHNQSEGGIATQLQPRLLSVADACRYVSVSRSEFYETWMPKLQCRRAGKRRLIERDSLDQVISELPCS